MKLIMIVIATLWLSSCSHKSIYDGIKHSQKLECQKVVSTQYDECISRSNVTYKEYTEQREETLGIK